MLFFSTIKFRHLRPAPKETQASRCKRALPAAPRNSARSVRNASGEMPPSLSCDAPAGVRRVSAGGLNYSRVARKQRREGKSCLHPLEECEDDGRAQPGWISAQNVPALVGEGRKKKKNCEKNSASSASVALWRRY